LGAFGAAAMIAEFESRQVEAQTKRPPSAKVTKPTPKPTNNFRGPPAPNKPSDNQRRFADQHRGAPPASDFVRQSTQPAAAAPAPKPAPPFDAEKSPPPIDCFNAYVAATRKATRMEEILSYLPQSQQEQLKAEQSKFNPKEEAKEREQFRKLHPKFTKDELDRHFASPYEERLRYHKAFANEVIKVISVDEKDNTAFLTVLTEENVTIGGVFYRHGKSNVNMVGEGTYWKLKDHGDTGWRFK
jgi:hypothetical protein